MAQLIIEDKEMPKGWNPKQINEGHLDRTKDFLKPDGISSSIRLALNACREGRIEPGHFYVFSTRISHFYRITVTRLESQKIDLVVAWLKSMKLEKYTDAFESNDYTDLEEIKSFSKDEIEEMIQVCNLKVRSANKIRKNLYTPKDYKEFEKKRALRLSLTQSNSLTGSKNDSINSPHSKHFGRDDYTQPHGTTLSITTTTTTTATTIEDNYSGKVRVKLPEKQDDYIGRTNTCDSYTGTTPTAKKKKNPYTGKINTKKGISFEKGNILGEYTIEKPLGSGHFGTTYLVKKKKKQFALKHVTCKSIEQQNRALKEVSALGKINSLNVVSFEGTFLTQQGVAIVMHFCMNGNLEDFIKDRRALTTQLACSMILDIATGLTEFHNKHMIHRDIKPDNLMLDGKRVLIGDLGLARTIEYNYTSGVAYMWYMAPEVQSKKLHSNKSDIWSLGCVMFALLARELLETREGFMWRMTEQERKKDIDNSIKGFPAEFQKCIYNCLRTDPKNRPSANSIIQEMKTILSKRSSEN